MSACRQEIINSGAAAIPRSCPTCGIRKGCARGLAEQPPTLSRADLADIRQQGGPTLHPLQAITDAPSIVPEQSAECCNKTVRMRCKGCPHEKQGTGFDPGATGHELQGRATQRRAVLAFTGLAGSGKSTAAQHIVDNNKATRVRFAGPLKAMAAALGLSHEEIEGSLKEKPSSKLTHGNFINLMESTENAFNAIGVNACSGYVPLLCGRDFGFAIVAFMGVLARVVVAGEGKGGATPRLLMQMIGTEWGRDLIGPTLWIDLWRDAVDKLPPDQAVIVDDCRFPNEAQAVRDYRGFIAHVERPGAGAGAAGHSSEGQALPRTHTLDNVGSVVDLQGKVNVLWRDLSWAFAAD